MTINQFLKELQPHGWKFNNRFGILRTYGGLCPLEVVAGTGISSANRASHKLGLSRRDYLKIIFAADGKKTLGSRWLRWRMRRALGI